MSRLIIEMSRLEWLIRPNYPRRILLEGEHLSPEMTTNVECQIRRIEREEEGLASEQETKVDPIMLWLDLSLVGVRDKDQMAADHLHDVVVDSQVPVWGFVPRSCRFADMYVFQACEKRIIARGAFIQFHEIFRILPTDILTRDDAEVEATASIPFEVQRSWGGREIMRAYHKRNPHLLPEDFRVLMRRRKTFSAEEALQLDLVDLIVDL